MYSIQMMFTLCCWLLLIVSCSCGRYTTSASQGLMQSPCIGNIATATTDDRKKSIDNLASSERSWWEKLYWKHCEPIVLTIRPYKPSPTFIEERMKIFRSRGFNHHSPSSTDQTKLPEGTKQTTTNRYDAKISTTKCANGYVKKSIYAKIGNGEEVFNRAKEVVLTGQLTNSIPWCRLIRIPPTSKHMQIGDTIATLIQFYKLPVWSLNPCHVVDVIHQQTSSSSKRVLVKYSTLQGHLLQGEESFEVRISPSIGGQDAASKRSEVHFEMVTYSKASGLLGSLCLPLIRPLQDKFLQSHVQSCLQLIQQQQ